MKLKKLVGLVLVLGLVIAGGVVASGYLTRDLEGTMEWSDLEGGFWTVAADGEHYIPVNLAEEYMVEGLTVEFKVVERPDMMGIHMGGTYVEILE